LTIILIASILCSLFFLFLKDNYYKDVNAYTVNDAFIDDTYIDAVNSSNYILSGGQISASTRSYTFGTGADGACTVSSNMNINTQSCVGRAYGDAVRFQKYSTYTANAGTNQMRLSTSTLNGLAVGDEVLIITQDGLSSFAQYTGQYETVTISNITGDTLTFETNLQNTYYSSNNIAIIRVPQYTDVTVNEGFAITSDTKSLLANAGVIFFKATGTVAINGSINGATKGFPGGTACSLSCTSSGERGADYAKGRAQNAGKLTYGNENGENETYAGGGGGGGMYLKIANVDNYANTNYVSTNFDIYGANGKQGQSFTGNGGAIDSLKLYMKKSGSPTGNGYAKIYSHSGTFGTSSVPDTLLATSDAFDVSTLTTTIALINFNFSGDERITLTNGTNYVVVLEYTGGNSSNKVLIGADSTSPTHGGNRVSHDGTNWQADNTHDLIFYVYSDNGPVDCGIGGTGGVGGAGGGGGTSLGNLLTKTKGGGGGGGGYGTGGGGGSGYQNGGDGGDNSGTGGNAYCGGVSGEAYAGGGGGGGNYGVADLSLLFLGAGGGSGGSGSPTSTGAGGAGGGIVYIYGQNVVVGANGSVNANGADGSNAGAYSGGGGGGAGGSVKLYTNSITLGNDKVTANGGIGGTGAYSGGNGGDGRIHIDYVSSISGTTTPLAHTTQLPQYQNQTSIQSLDILPGDENMKMISFDYSISSLPSGTSATAQFSTDATTWYNSGGVEDGSDTLVQGNSNSIDLSSLDWETDSFYYKIEFDNDEGVATPVLDDISLSYDQAPLAPTIETPETISTSSIRWNFTDNSDNELGFKLYNYDNSLIETEETSDLSYIEEINLLPNTQYRRKISSYNILGDSNYSEETSKYTFADIPVLTFGTVNKNSIGLNVTNATNLSSGTSGILFNCINSGCNTGINTWVQNSTATSSSLQPNTQYSYKAKARNAEGIESGYSSTISQYTLSDIPNLTATALTSTSITLYATNVNNLEQVSSGLLFSCSSSNCNTGINEWVQNSTDSSLNLIPNTQYSYSVKARNAESIETSSSSTLSRYTLANTPTISCLTTTSTTITLSVEKNSNPDNTNILINESSSNKYLDKTLGVLSDTVQWGTFTEFTTNNSYTVKSLTPSTAYTFRVKARNGDAIETAYSESTTCYTKASTVQPPTTPSTTQSPTPPPVTEEPPMEIPKEQSNKLTSEEKKAVLDTIKDTATPIKTIKDNDKVTITLGEKNISVNEKTKLSIYANNTLDVGIPINTISSLNPNSSIKGVYIESNGEITKLALDSTSYFYETKMDIFNSLGTYDLNILAMFDDNTSVRMKLEVLVDPYGFVYEKIDENELRLSNAQVTLYAKLDDDWNIYGIANNPQYTNTHGEYQFLVEPGTYKIKVELDGYETYESEEIEVEKTTIEMNIEMNKIKKEYLLYIYIGTGLILTVGILLILKKRKS
jgi:hypothetical protein